MITREQLDAQWTLLINRLYDNKADIPDIVGIVARLVLMEREFYLEKKAKA